MSAREEQRPPGLLRQVGGGVQHEELGGYGGAAGGGAAALAQREGAPHGAAAGGQVGKELHGLRYKSGTWPQYMSGTGPQETKEAPHQAAIFEIARRQTVQLGRLCSSQLKPHCGAHPTHP